MSKMLLFWNSWVQFKISRRRWTTRLSTLSETRRSWKLRRVNAPLSRGGPVISMGDWGVSARTGADPKRAELKEAAWKLSDKIAVVIGRTGRNEVCDVGNQVRGVRGHLITITCQGRVKLECCKFYRKPPAIRRCQSLLLVKTCKWSLKLQPVRGEWRYSNACLRAWLTDAKSDSQVFKF